MRRVKSIKRREFISGIAGAAATWPLAARAQSADKPRLIAVLMSVAENDPDSRARIQAFRDGLSALGWVDGGKARIEVRWGGADSARIQQYAEELVALKPDVIFANGTPVVQAFQRVTSTIPIVFAPIMDPVGLGVVQSLSRPGGNVTGFTFFDPDLIGKWRELLAQAAPAVRRSALIFNPRLNPAYYDYLRQIERSSQAAGAIAAAAVETIDAIQSVVAEQARTLGGSLMIGPDAFLVVHMKEVADLAIQYRLPGISIYRKFADEGGLMSYGTDIRDILRRSASYVDRILRGANPAELPVQQPTEFEFVINLKTAKALGLAMPSNLLAQADEVIE
jgi:putative tryptophan/tyrosine transport system substrate-binding protein